MALEITLLGELVVLQSQSANLCGACSEVMRVLNSESSTFRMQRCLLGAGNRTYTQG